MRDKGTLAIIVGACIVLSFGLGMMAGGSISTAHADRERNATIDALESRHMIFDDIDNEVVRGIANVVSAGILEAQEPLECKEAVIIEAIKTLVSNGIYIKGFSLGLKVGDTIEMEYGQ